MVGLCVSLLLLGVVGCRKEERDPNAPMGMTPTEYAETPEGKQRAESPDGTSTEIEQVDDVAKFGLAQYPGSTLEEDRGAVFHRSSPGAEQTIYTLSTADPVDKVLAFYAKELDDVEPFRNGDEAMTVGNLKDGQTVVVSITRVNEKTSVKVEISREAAGPEEESDEPTDAP